VTGARDFPGIGFDPAPGSVAVLEVLAASLADTSARLREADRLLASAGRRPDGQWAGAAADAFARQASELPARVGRAGTSYGDVGRAVAAYATSLDGLQRAAHLVEADALDARRRIEAAHGQVDSARQSVTAASFAQRGADHTTPDAHAAVRQAGDAYRSASLVLGTAEDDLRRAIARARAVAEEHETAAERVVQAIGRAGQLAPPAPGVFARLGGLVTDIARSARDRFDDFVSDHAPAIRLLADTCGAISAAMGMLSLLPVLGFLGIPAAVLGLGAFACHLALAAADDGTWKDVALDAAGLVSFGAGRRLEAAYQGASKAADAARENLRAARVRGTVHAQRLAAMTTAEQRALNRGVALTQQKLLDGTLNAGSLVGFAKSYPDNAPTYRRGWKQTRGLVGAGLRSFHALEVS